MQDSVTTSKKDKKVTNVDPFRELGTTKEDVDQRIEDHEARLKALEDFFIV